MAERPPASSLAAAAPVLVAIVNNREDWRRVMDERWYRIPLNRLPYPVAAEALAFYLTRPFGADAWQIAWFAPVLGYRVQSRRELIPAEPDHPRANDRYYRVALAPIQRLARPIPSQHLRRISFIPTTFGRLCDATDVADLWQIDDTTELLWTHFPDAAIKATARLELDE